MIGRPALNVSESEALSYVLGYVAANDVSARSEQLNAQKSYTSIERQHTHTETDNRNHR